eukprot:Tamp_31966.p1 GENE.Tamp_31966~~Tamp_31966.p1  ORF type:complete len:173 (+),score=43.27 Tamp_31966:32-550(+)
MDDFYLPAAPPAHLTGYALRVLAEKRVVGSPMRSHTYIRQGALATEYAKIGKHAAAAQRDGHEAGRQFTDVTRHGAGCAPAEARGAPHCTQPSEEDQAKLADFRQARASARSQARGARDRAEFRRAAVRLAPGEDAIRAARKTVELARAAREQQIRQKHAHDQALFLSYYQL